MSLTLRELAAEAESRWAPDPTRLLKAVQIVEGRTNIYNNHCPAGEFDVRSQSGLNSWHRVNTKSHTCTCEDSQRGHVCKHRLAVWLYVQANIRPLSEVRRKPEAVIMRELGYA